MRIAAPVNGARAARLFPAALSAALLFACSPPVGEYFPDHFFPQDRIYENRPLGFTLTFTGNWNIATEPRAMTPEYRAVARTLYESHAELLFLGYTAERSQGARGIVNNLNVDNEEYLSLIRRMYARNIGEDFGFDTVDAGQFETLAWHYTFNRIHFVEYLFRSGTYNVRIAFWTTAQLFPKFRPVYEEMIRTLSRVSRM